MTLHITRQHLYDMLAHGMAEDPAEACGLLAARDGRVVKVYRLRNAEEDPTRRTRYTIHPQDQIRAMREMDEQGWELMGIFHSHPRTRAYPSATDLARSSLPGTDEPLYPGVCHLIVSLEDGTRPSVRAFRLDSRPVIEEPIAVDAEE